MSMNITQQGAYGIVEVDGHEYYVGLSATGDLRAEWMKGKEQGIVIKVYLKRSGLMSRTVTRRIESFGKKGVQVLARALFPQAA